MSEHLCDYYYYVFVPCVLQEITFPKMVANCCRFLCYFCRISRQNQKAMFDHLSYLLENSSVGLGECMDTWVCYAFPLLLSLKNLHKVYFHM